jgi:hypothetical protein
MSRLRVVDDAVPGLLRGFEVRFLDAAGAERREQLTAAFEVDFEAAPPVRSFPSYHGQRNYPGLWWAATMMLLDFDPRCSPRTAGSDSATRSERSMTRRLDYHVRLVIVRTPTVDKIVRTGRRLVLLNRHQTSARRGLIVTGQPATGKTTSITQLGKAHELQLRHRLADRGPASRSST